MEFLNAENFSGQTEKEKTILKDRLDSIISEDCQDGNLFRMTADFHKILTDNQKRSKWKEITQKLGILFQCGTYSPVSGPMVGVSISIRDTDYFKKIAEIFGKDRSVIANMEWMATCWNATFAHTGIWMGKTFEPVTKEVIAEKCDNNSTAIAFYDKPETGIGRNFFRKPINPTTLQAIGLPALTKMWKLQERPTNGEIPGYQGTLTDENLGKEKVISYSKTGGHFLCTSGASVLKEMNGKKVYQLNYRWPNLSPTYPMTRLVDEIVQIGEGIYLGQLIFATRHYSSGSLEIPTPAGKKKIKLGEDYNPHKESKGGFFNWIKSLFSDDDSIDYEYINNGYFLMMDPAFSEKFYADIAFPFLRPQIGEI